MVSSRTENAVNALDGVMNINTFYTFAIFVGVSSTIHGEISVEGPQCDAGPDMAKRVYFFEFLSFSFFLTSSIVAQGLKLALLLRYVDDSSNEMERIDNSILKMVLHITLATSSLGFLFLVLSVTQFIQIRLGIWSCGSAAMYISVFSLALPLTMGAAMQLYALQKANMI